MPLLYALCLLLPAAALAGQPASLSARAPAPAVAKSGGAAEDRAGRSRWTVAIYAGIDEEEIAAASDPGLAALLHDPLPPSVQLLLEKDTWGSGGVLRAERTGRAPATEQLLPEHDSSDPERFRDFLRWVKARARGRYTLLLVATHSWGWKGIIQDFTLPDAPGKNRMMPLRVFARLFDEEAFHPDVAILDACVMGTVDAIHEVRGLSRYLLTSQRETPYQGLPFRDLLAELHSGKMTPRRLARELPERYVREYGRDGAFAKAEGEFDVVTFAGLDMDRWDAFVERFAAFTEAARTAGLRERLQANPDWAEVINDDDHNADLLETIRRVQQLLPEPEVVRLGRELEATLGYPAAASAANLEALTIEPRKGPRFTLWLQRDRNVAPPFEKDRFQARWEDLNQDLPVPENLAVAFEGEWTTVSGPSGSAPWRLRPWMAGVKVVRLDYAGGARPRREIYRHQRDFISARRFPESSFLLSEAHTQGAPFVHGLGILLHPLMNLEEVKSEDRYSGLKGPAAYKALEWNRRTKWGDLTLLEPPVPPPPPVQ
jgi:Clostripain family